VITKQILNPAIKSKKHTLPAQKERNFLRILFMKHLFRGSGINAKIYWITLIIITLLCEKSYAKSTIEEVGDYLQIIVPAYSFGMAMNEKDGEGMKQFGHSFIAMQATIIGLKLTVNENRPDGSDNNSFPSGHTASAFSGAMFIHQRYGIEKAIVPYFLAGFTAFSRIDAKKHNFLDVLAGAGISGLYTCTFVDKYVDVDLCVSPVSVGMGVNINF
jgi:membrane-associated phospholipid phosphatase